MKKITLAALAVSLGVLATFSSGCTTCPPGNAMCVGGPGGSGGSGAGGGAGGGLQLYDIYTLDTAYSDRFYMDLTVDETATKSRVGIAYIAGRGEIPLVYIVLPDGGGDITNSDAGVGDGGTYEVKYVEWEDGVARAPQSVDTVRRMAGISIDFHPATGEPAIGYLGGGSDMSVFWINSDAELSVRAGGVTWMKSAAATTGFQVTCGNPVSDQAAGVIVGIWPAVAYQEDGTLWYCYRDVHTGQYPQGDWGGADVECVHGSPGAWTRECTYAGGNNKLAPGGRIDMVMVNDVPTIIWDHVTGGADTRGTDIELQTHTGAAAWTTTFNAIPSGDTQSGGSIAFDAMTEGLGIAGVDLTQGILFYTHRLPGTTQFTTNDRVVGEGSSGWYPSLAMDPLNHEPAIAYYACSTRSNANPSQCQPAFDEVRVTSRTNDDWQNHTETVDSVSVTTVKMGFLPNGRKVIAYRELNGTLKLAVRKSP